MLSKYNVITLFPNLFDEWMKTGIISNGLDKNILEFQTTNLRDFGIGNYKQTDDAPYGGGPGMVMMVEPLDNAILNNKADINVFLTPSGSKLDEKTIHDLLAYDSINIICGRYEGFDQRIIDMHADYEISIGQSFVSGGEVPALYLLEALIRKIPDVLGNPESLKSETFTDNKIDYPVYTRPEIFKNKKVPEVLLSGNHQKIDEWKKNNLKDI